MTNEDGWVLWNFVLEDDTIEGLTHEEYLQHEELTRRVADKKRFARLLCGRWIWLWERERMRGDKRLMGEFRGMENEMRQNGLKYFMPSVVKRHPGDAIDFLNDTDSDIKIIRSPNQVGKSCHSTIDLLLDIIPTDPEWDIFTDNAVRYREFTDPLQCLIASSEIEIHRSRLWPGIVQFCPWQQLGMYATGQKRPSWTAGPRAELESGSLLLFKSYTQNQASYASIQVDRCFWDEQVPKPLRDEGRRGTATRGHTPAEVFAFTPHRIEGRPDTGGSSWIVEMGENPELAGDRIVSVYTITLDDVPDWLYSEKEKRALKRDLEIAVQKGDKATERRLRARIYGEPEAGGGLVYDDFMPEYHVISPIPIEPEWSLYRCIDHGTRNPTACLWAAVTPENDVYFFRGYYKERRTISENCRGIAEASGNRLVRTQAFRDERTGTNLESFEEVFVNEGYHLTLFDPRSFKQSDPLHGKTIGQLYGLSGIRARPAKAPNSENRIPAVKQWLQIDYSRPHPHNVDKDGKPLRGRPKVFVFDTIPDLMREISKFEWMTIHPRRPDELPKEVPQKKADHLVNCLEYLLVYPICYVGSTSPKTREGTTGYADLPTRYD